MNKSMALTRLAPHLGLALLLLPLGACSGGGGSGTASSSEGQFSIQTISVSPGQSWQINRPIMFTFSRPVDFDTVNMNTINVARLNGAPAIGSFLLDAADPRRVSFLPACPTVADFSDAGLLPGGVSYRILIPGADSSALTVRSKDGKPLSASQTLVFQTPTTSVLTQLFLDPVSGPPSVLLRQTPGAVGTRLVLGGDVSNPVYFALDPDGLGRPENGLAVPLNLYSQPESRLQVLLEFNQPVSPSLENISASRLRLQFDANPDPDIRNWTPIATQVELVANCTATGATVRLTPVGVLPQNRDLRVFVSAEFEDLVGDRNILPLTDFARMTSDFFKDSNEDPIPFTDELLETFILSGNQVGSLEDTTAVFDGPAAKWSGGRLAASFGFSGSGGPNGTFDFHVPPNTDFILDTVATLVTGGPGGLPVAQQLVLGGRLDVRNLLIPATSTLRFQGPNPALIMASGTVNIHGRIVANGNPGRSVFTVNTPMLPETGGSGQGGGGRGGTGSPITNGASIRGGPGWGAFNVEGLGGEGGESGYSTDGGDNGLRRKVAGGGGGSFGHDQIIANCPDQTLVGLDAEDGFPGAPEALSAPRAPNPMPWGGRVGPKPFNNPTGSAAERVDDFFGVKIADFGTPQARLVVGELPRPWAGAGGGGGGDAVGFDSYPPPTFVANQHKKGAGGGGGAGSLHIQALGSITLHSTGRIEARGGPGGRGESVNWQWSVGGGSGGGSGGHIILQTADKLDFSQAAASSILARGGQGGSGPQNQGGAHEGGERPPNQDSIHTGAAGDNPFSVSGCPTTQPFVRTAGGDGGPGIIQLHVSNLQTDILYPSGGVTQLGNVCRPAPAGFTWTGQAGTSGWTDHLLPEFGSISRSRSKWIPLGEAAVSPFSGTPSPLAFFFEGTNPGTGQVITSGDDVQPLPPVLAPAGTIEDAGLPELDPEDPRTLRLSGADLAPANSFYRDNPYLMRRFEVVVTPQGADPISFDVAAVSYDSSLDVFSLSVGGEDLPTSGSVEVRPRFFLVETSGVQSLLPGNATVQIQFQATRASATGAPDESSIFPGTNQWATNIGQLTNAPVDVNTAFRYFRFQVSFDIGTDLNFDAPQPALDFLRIPYRF